MPKSKHNVTKRGTQKQRVQTHHEAMAGKHPEIVHAEFQQAMGIHDRFQRIKNISEKA